MANRFLGKLIHSTKLKAGACLSLIILADFLFYGELTGWTLGGFAAVFLTLFLLGNPLALRTAGGKFVAVLTSGQCLLLIDNPDLLSLMLYISGITKKSDKGYGKNNRKCPSAKNAFECIRGSSVPYHFSVFS